MSGMSPARIALLASFSNVLTAGVGLIGLPILNAVEQSKTMKAQASATRVAGQQALADSRKQALSLRGAQRSVISSAGVGESGSALDLLASTASQQGLNALRARSPYLARTEELRAQASGQAFAGIPFLGGMLSGSADGTTSLMSLASLAASAYSGGAAGAAAAGGSTLLNSRPASGARTPPRRPGSYPNLIY